MGRAVESLVALRLFGDDLIPDHISSLLGARPTACQIKGQELVGRKTGKVRVAKTGGWLLKAHPREPEDLEAQVFELLDGLTSDLSVWASLSQYAPDLFCGIFMGTGNDGLSLSAKAMSALGQRGISLALDLYDPGDEPASGETP